MATLETEKKSVNTSRASPNDEEAPVPGEVINVSGHVQELDRNFGIWSMCSIGIVSNNAWAAGGGSLAVAFYNGGGPGVLYGLIAATFFYIFIGLSLAELSSAIPSSANVYHWASVAAGPKYGRIFSWYGGWWNAIAWVFGTASVSAVGANAIVAMYALYHPGYAPERWQIFIAFLGITWFANSLVLFGQRYLNKVATVSGFLCVLFVVVTTLVCAIMPSQTGAGYSSNAFVWSDFSNLTGWSNNGIVFIMGMLNGAFAIGTPDGVCHLCEEIPNPRVNVPKGIAAQIVVGFVTTFFFYISVLYGVTALDDVLETNIVSLPLAAMFQQATRSTAGTTGLLTLLLIDLIVTVPGAYITSGRMLWVLARDSATPASPWVCRVSPRWRNPFNAQLICGACVTVLGIINIGSATAFNAFVGTFAILTTLSYLSAILPHLLSGRKHVVPGPFWMPKPWGPIVLCVASAYIIVFDVIYMFPYAVPVDAQGMNYSCVMAGSITILLSLGYLWKRRHGYVGPRVALSAKDGVMVGMVGLTKAEEEATRRASFGTAP